MKNGKKFEKIAKNKVFILDFWLMNSVFEFLFVIQNVVLIKWIAGLRLKHCNGETFVASGLSDKPVEKIK